MEVEPLELFDESMYALEFFKQDEDYCVVSLTASTDTTRFSITNAYDITYFSSFSIHLEKEDINKIATNLLETYCEKNTYGFELTLLDGEKFSCNTLSIGKNYYSMNSYCLLSKASDLMIKSARHLLDYLNIPYIEKNNVPDFSIEMNPLDVDTVVSTIDKMSELDTDLSFKICTSNNPVYYIGINQDIDKETQEKSYKLIVSLSPADKDEIREQSNEIIQTLLDLNIDFNGEWEFSCTGRKY